MLELRVVRNSRSELVASFGGDPTVNRMNSGRFDLRVLGLFDFCQEFRRTVIRRMPRSARFRLAVPQHPLIQTNERESCNRLLRWWANKRVRLFASRAC